ncbi:MAG: hypothetical protein C4330_12575 [Chitinophagaceae bacterium]
MKRKELLIAGKRFPNTYCEQKNGCVFASNNINAFTMKNTNFLLVAMIAVLSVITISCTPAQQIADYDQRPVYNSNPYGSNVIVVERDPYTGRYYQVNPNGVYLNDPYYNTNRYYDPYSRGYDSRYYNHRNYDRGRVYGNTNTNTNTNVNSQPTQDEKERAKDKVFGRRN